MYFFLSFTTIFTTIAKQQSKFESERIEVPEVYILYKVIADIASVLNDLKSPVKALKVFKITFNRSTHRF